MIKCLEAVLCTINHIIKMDGRTNLSFWIMFCYVSLVSREMHKSQINAMKILCLSKLDFYVWNRHLIIIFKNSVPVSNTFNIYRTFHRAKHSTQFERNKPLLDSRACMLIECVLQIESNCPNQVLNQTDRPALA